MDTRTSEPFEQPGPFPCATDGCQTMVGEPDTLCDECREMESLIGTLETAQEDER